MDLLETLSEIRRAGKIRLLGVTNFDTPHLAEMLQSEFELGSIQCQYSLLDRRPEREMLELCQKHNVQLLPYGVLAGGFLTQKYLGAASPESMNRSLIKYRLIIDEAGGWQSLQSLLNVLHEIGDRHGVSASAVAARWVLEQPCIGAIMLGVGTKSRAAQNRLLANLKLDEDDRRDIGAVLSELKIPPGDVYELERDFSGPHPKIIKMNLHDSQ